MNTSYGSATFASDGPQVTAVAPRRHFDYFAPRAPGLMATTAFSFAISACLLGASAAGVRNGIFGFLALVALLLVLFPHAVVRANYRNALLWLYPAWAVFSTQWSIDGDRTLHQIMLLLPTIAAGVTLGGLPHRRGVGAGAALALALYIVYSLAYGATILFSDTGSGGSALSGIASGKNYFGHIAATSLMMAPFLLTVAHGRWKVPMIVVTAAVMAASGFALLKSYATGSMLATCIAFMTLAAVLIFRRISWQFRIVLIAGVVGMLIIYINFGQELQDQLFAAVLKTFNKDVSLTGRTVLWDHADKLIAERPLLGYGYGAFWYHTNPEAWTIWRMMGVRPMSGFNFHNTVRDTIIEVGMIGFAIYVFGFGISFLKAVMRALSRGDVVAAAGVAFITYFIIRMPVESTGIASVTIDTVLIVAFLSKVPLAHGPKTPNAANGTRSRDDGSPRQGVGRFTRQTATRRH